MTTETGSETAENGETADRHEDSFPVKEAIRKLGAMEDIRAYVYRTLIDIMPDRIYAKDRQSRFILANRAVARLMGKKGPEELIGKTDFDFYPSEMAAEYLAVERKIFETGEPQIALEQFVPNLPNGEPEWLQTTKVPLRDFEGDVIGLVGIARDVTLRKRGEEEIKRQNAELAEANAKLTFAYQQLLRSAQLAGVGHLAARVVSEIDDPLVRAVAGFNAIETRLAGVSAQLETLAKACRGDASPEAVAQLHRMREEVDFGDLLRETRDGLARVTKIVRDLAEFSAVESCDEWADMDLHHAIDSALNMLASEIRQKAEVVTEYGVIPPVHCVASQINQVILNLLVNAAQAIGSTRGTINVRTGQDGDEVWFEVSDTGSGMGNDVLAHVFEPFFTTRPVDQGAGLGLPLSVGIVERHKGRIEISSEVGQGSTFRVRLPVGPAKN